MSALISACNTQQTVRNTGSECNTSMGVTAMLYMVPSTLRLSVADISTIETTMQRLIQGDVGNRAYPFGGTTQPISNITDNNEADVFETLPNGQQIFIRPGYLNRQFSTINGGQCLYNALRSFNASGFSIIEVDVNGNVRLKVYTNTTTSVVTYGGINATISAPSPTFANFTVTYKNNFAISISPAELAQTSIFSGGINLLSQTGLLDVTVRDGGTDTSAVLHALAFTSCANANLYNNYSTQLASPTAWVVKDTGTAGAPITPTVVTLTGVTINAGLKGWNLAGTFTTGHIYQVNLNTPFNLDTLSVDGFEGFTPALITV